MSNEPRKATDVILALEEKVNTLLGIVKSLEFNVRLLSSKLDIVTKKDEVIPANNIVVEAVNTNSTTFPSYDDRNIKIDSEKQLPIEESPQGFRRTSRPETYAGDNAYLTQPNKQFNHVTLPPQIPNQKQSEPNTDVIVPPEALRKNVLSPPDKHSTKQQELIQNAVPVMQRIVDKNGKSVFLANVDILDKATNQSVFKTRTNATGKWMASLGIGEYLVVIRKVESLSKDKVEIKQEIRVDGTQSPYELQTMIIKT